MPVPTPPWSVRISNHAQDLDENGHLPAVEVPYDDTTTLLGVADVQAAIEAVASGSVPSSGGLVPTFIDSTETFTVPANRQALFAMTIDNEGILDVVGFLIEVD